MTKKATNVEKMVEEENKKDENISKPLCTQQDTLSPRERNDLVYQPHTANKGETWTRILSSMKTDTFMISVLVIRTKTETQQMLKKYC